MIIKSKRIYMEDGCKSGYLEIEDALIKKYYPEDSGVAADVDYGNNRIIPGLVDTHSHSASGARFVKAEDSYESNFKIFLKGCASLGATASVVTTTDLKVMNALTAMPHKSFKGARFIGIHSEGPWGSRVGEGGINTGYPKVDLEYGQKLYDACNGQLLKIDIAPEIENAKAGVDFFLKKDIPVAIYHTNANYEQANRGIDWGMTIATHLGNVMTGLHHRDIGTMGACINRDEVWCELICDGFNVSLPMLEIIFKLKPLDKIMMVSDSLTWCGAPAGRYAGLFNYPPESDRSEVTYEGDGGLVYSKTGRISGCGATLMDAIENLVEKIGMPMETVCRLSSYNPCKKYGLIDKKGSILEGKDADLVVISDDYQILNTYVEGKMVYDKEKEGVIFNQEFVDKFRVGDV